MEGKGRHSGVAHRVAAAGPSARGGGQRPPRPLSGRGKSSPRLVGLECLSGEEWRVVVGSQAGRAPGVLMGWGRGEGECEGDGALCRQLEGTWSQVSPWGDRGTLTSLTVSQRSCPLTPHTPVAPNHPQPCTPFLSSLTMTCRLHVHLIVRLSPH